jgi:hypothetical protein
LQEKAEFYVGSVVGDSRWELKFGPDEKAAKRIKLVMITIDEESKQ